MRSSTAEGPTFNVDFLTHKYPACEAYYKVLFNCFFEKGQFARIVPENQRNLLIKIEIIN